MNFLPEASFVSAPILGYDPGIQAFEHATARCSAVSGKAIR